MRAATWDAVDELADELSKVISQKSPRIDLIVAVARGGFVPARLLSSRLGVKRMTSIGVTYLDEDRRTPTIYSLPGPIEPGCAILLVEDALESGRSLLDAKRALETAGATVSTAAFYYRGDSIMNPDFTLGEIDEIPRFPWE